MFNQFLLLHPYLTSQNQFHLVFINFKLCCFGYPLDLNPINHLQFLMYYYFIFKCLNLKHPVLLDHQLFDSVVCYLGNSFKKKINYFPFPSIFSVFQYHNLYFGSPLHLISFLFSLKFFQYWKLLYY